MPVRLPPITIFMVPNLRIDAYSPSSRPRRRPHVASGAMKVGPGVLPQDGERLRDSACSLIRDPVVFMVKQRPLHFKFSFARAQDVATDIIIMRLQVLFWSRSRMQSSSGDRRTGRQRRLGRCYVLQLSCSALLLSTYRARLKGGPQVA